MLKLPNYTAIAYQCKVYYLFFGSVNWVVAPAGPATCPSTTYLLTYLGRTYLGRLRLALKGNAPNFTH